MGPRKRAVYIAHMPRSTLPLLMVVLLFACTNDHRSAREVDVEADTLSDTVHDGPWLIGYYAGSGTDLGAKHLEQLTHLIWCFTHVRNDSMVFDSRWDADRARAVVDLRKRYPELKVLISMGGWGGCAPCSGTFASARGRRTFTASCKALLDSTGADGLDLDWEYPAVPGPKGHRYVEEDRHDFTLLVRELRTALGPAKEICFAAGGEDHCLIKGFEWDSIMPLVDRVHIMSYDLVHGFSDRTGHHSPLYSCPQQRYSADHAVRLLDSLHVPRGKVVIGAAFYSRVFRGVDAKDHGLFRPGTYSISIPFNALDTTITAAKGWTWFQDDIAKARFAYNAQRREFLTCDDSTSVALKARYVREQGLGGIMFWQLRDDRAEHGLLDAIHTALGAY